MVIIKGALKLCAIFAGLFILAYIIQIFRVSILIIINLIKREPIKYLAKELNVFAVSFPKLFKNDEELGKKEKENKKIEKILVVIISIGLIYSAIIYSPLASEEIGSIFEKGEYTAYYYVSMFPESSKSKNYQVKAKIYVHTEEYGEDHSERRYDIQEAYFPNGGKITFEYSEDFESLQVNEKVRVQDDEDRWWNIELTTKKAEN